MSRSAEGAKWHVATSTVIPRLQRCEDYAHPSGPLAQAITFRAFGAETGRLHTRYSCVLPTASCLLLLRLNHTLIADWRDRAAVFHLD
jgi:hypothetical protein